MRANYKVFDNPAGAGSYLAFTSFKYFCNSFNFTSLSFKL